MEVTRDKPRRWKKGTGTYAKRVAAGEIPRLRDTRAKREAEKSVFDEALSKVLPK